MIGIVTSSGNVGARWTCGSPMQTAALMPIWQAAWTMIGTKIGSIDGDLGDGPSLVDDGGRSHYESYLSHAQEMDRPSNSDAAGERKFGALVQPFQSLKIPQHATLLLAVLRPVNL